MMRRIRAAGALIFALLLVGCTYSYDEPHPPVEVSETPQAKLTVRNINSTPNGFEVTNPFPAEGLCSYDSTWSMLMMDGRDYSALVTEYVGSATLLKSDMKNESLRPNLHYNQDEGVTIIVPDDLFQRILNKPLAPNGIIRIVRQTAESLVRENVSDFNAFLRIVGADDTPRFYIAKSSCLNGATLPSIRDRAAEHRRCWFDLTIPTDSPDCPPSKLLDNGERRIDTLPASGPCSVEEASHTQAEEIDFTQYIRLGGIAEPMWRVHGGTVVLPAVTFNELRAKSPEIPDDSRQMYPITQDSYESLKASMPSLAKAVYNWDSQGFVQSYYLTSDFCLSLTPPVE